MKTFQAKPRILKRGLENISSETVEKKNLGFEYDEPLVLDTISLKMEKKLAKVAKVIQDDPVFNFDEPVRVSYVVRDAPEPISVLEVVPDVEYVELSDDLEEVSKKSLDTSFFTDHVVDDPFVTGVIHERHMEDASTGIERIIMDSKNVKRPKTKNSKVSSDLKGGRERSLIENVIYCLDGLIHHDSDVIGKGLVDLMEYMNEKDFFLIVRAHGVIRSLYEAILKMASREEWIQHSVQVLVLIMLDEKNCEFLPRNVFDFLMNHVDKVSDVELFLDCLANVKKSTKNRYLESSDVDKQLNLLMQTNRVSRALTLKFLFLCENLDMEYVLQLCKNVQLYDDDVKIEILRHTTNATHGKNENCEKCNEIILKELSDLVGSKTQDVVVLSLGILINISEYFPERLDNLTVNRQPFVDFVVTEFKHKSGSNNESKIVAYYYAIMIACLCRRSPVKTQILLLLSNFDMVQKMIQEFIQFQSQLRILSPEMLKSLQSLIESLKLEEYLLHQLLQL